MCGICGVAWADPDRPVDPALIDRMTDALAHRGPDGEGRHVAPGIGLGVRRLEIVDPTGGAQPIASEDGAVVVICNGEIYDAPERRTELVSRGHAFAGGSDVEVLVHLYEDHGLDAVHRLRGMFAFALWDARRRRLVLGRDRLGIKPLVVAPVDGGLAFASEIKSILASGLVEPALEPRALGDVFTYGFVRTPRTFVRGVRRVPAGELLVWEAGRPTARRYWSVDFPDPGEVPDRSRSEWAGALGAKLDETVRRHLRSDVPVGAWLSGGLDSSAVVALMERAAGPVDAWSIAFDDPRLDEVGRGRTLAEFPGHAIRARTVTCGPGDLARLPEALWHMEDPSVNGIEIPRTTVAEASAREVKVVLSGEGADEVLGGYPWYALDRILRPASRLPRALRERLAARGRRGVWRWVAPLVDAPREVGPERFAALAGPRNRRLAADLLADPAAALPDGGEEDAIPPGVDPERYAGWPAFRRLQAWDLAVRLPDLVLTKLDHSSMAYGLEARVPFLDHELVELCASIPPGLHWRRGLEKSVLREAMAGVLPREIARRRKRPLQAPHEAWMRGPLPGFAATLLSEPELAGRGHFRPEVARDLLLRHRTGEIDAGDLLFGVLSVQLWDETFLRGNGAAPAAAL